MLDQTNPLDPTGLTFERTGAQGGGTRQFDVRGFKDAPHAKAWAKAYRQAALGYGPVITVHDNADNIYVNVFQSTSCD
jgi:hypothetical protein